MQKVLTRDEQIKEIVRCGKDPIYFTKNYVKIQHAVKGAIPFETYPFQDDCLRQFQANRFNIVLKSRQLGLSTICADYAVWDAIFHKDRNILVIATKLDTAINFIKKVKYMIDSLPKWLLLPKYEHNRRSLRFNNGSTITAIPTSPDAGRSEAISLLIIDEAAWIDDFDAIWTGLSPTISTGGNAILLSTPNGIGGQYYKIWTDALSNANNFNAIQLPWHVHPEHDEEWFKSETRGLSRRQIAQEFECDFLTSGETFLQPETMEHLKAKIEQPAGRGDDRNLWVWRKPVYDHRYVISADVSRGDASDFSAFHVIDVTTSEVVAEYKGKVPPDKLADILYETGIEYNKALLCPENNTFGFTTCTRLKDKGYPRLYYMSCRGDPFTYTPADQDELPGFSTQQRSRVQVLTHLEQVLRNNMLRVFSQRLYMELQSFVWKGSKAAANKDSNDDLVISLAIGAWIAVDNAAASQGAIAMANALLQATGIVKNNIGSITAAIDAVGPVKSHTNVANQAALRREYSKAQDPARYGTSPNDFSWLLR